MQTPYAKANTNIICQHKHHIPTQPPHAMADAICRHRSPTISFVPKVGIMQSNNIVDSTHAWQKARAGRGEIENMRMHEEFEKYPFLIDRGKWIESKTVRSRQMEEQTTGSKVIKIIEDGDISPLYPSCLKRNWKWFLITKVPGVTMFGEGCTV